MATLPSYNINPAPRSGVSAYGKVPGAIALPNSLYAQTAGVLPALSALTTAAGANVGSEMAGQLSGGTLRQLQQQAAERAVGSGMPWTGTGNSLAGNRYLNSVAGSSEALSHQGINDYLALLGGIGSQQLQPELQAGIAERNALMASAPDPRKKAEQELSLFQKYLQNPAGGTGVYTGNETITPTTASGQPLYPTIRFGA